ncbi:MAG: hypothetical protein IPK16_13245 [Anaerolineales bacterium]|nr:hypothetical protein [Anaerolineales bacterium]
MNLVSVGERKREYDAPTKAWYRAILDDDPVWAAYAIADLQPKFDEHCIWGATSIMDTQPRDPRGLCLLFDGLEPPILLTAGNPAHVSAILNGWRLEGMLPPEVYLSMREEHEPVLLHYYDNSRDRRRMWRMVLEKRVGGNGRDEEEQPLPGANRQLSIANAETEVAHLVRLGPADGERIRQLYAHGGPFTPDAFDPWQLEEGVFFGIAGEDGELRAVGGTHIVDWDAGIGAIRQHVYASRPPGAWVCNAGAGAIVGGAGEPGFGDDHPECGSPE